MATAFKVPNMQLIVDNTIPVADFEEVEEVIAHRSVAVVVDLSVEVRRRQTEDHIYRILF